MNRRRIRLARETVARLAAPWIYEQAKNPHPHTQAFWDEIAGYDGTNAGLMAYTLRGRNTTWVPTPRY